MKVKSLASLQVLKNQLANETGAIGWILLWAVGIPIPLLLIFFLLRGGT